MSQASKKEIPFTESTDYRLWYHAGTGLVELTEKNGTTLVFQDGDWTYKGKNDITEETRNEWLAIIIESIQKASKSVKGKLPGWIKKDATDSTVGSDIANELESNGGSNTNDTNADKLNINNFATITKDTINRLRLELNREHLENVTDQNTLASTASD